MLFVMRWLVLMGLLAACSSQNDPTTTSNECHGRCTTDEVCFYQTQGVMTDAGAVGWATCVPWGSCSGDRTCECLTRELGFACTYECGVNEGVYQYTSGGC